MSQEPTSKVRGQLWDLVIVPYVVDWNPNVFGRGDSVSIDPPLPSVLFQDDAGKYDSRNFTSYTYRQPAVPGSELLLKVP